MDVALLADRSCSQILRLSFLGGARRLLGHRAKIGDDGCASLLHGALLSESLHLGAGNSIQSVVAVMQRTRLLRCLQLLIADCNVAHGRTGRVESLESCLIDATLRVQRLELVVFLHIVEDAGVLRTSPALIVATVLRAAS